MGKLIYTFAILVTISLIIILQSCTFENDAYDVSVDVQPPAALPGISSKPDQTEPDQEASTYQEKRLIFIEAANSYSVEITAGGLEVNGVFNDVNSKFMDLLSDRGSIDELVLGFEEAINEKAGFSITVSEPLRIDDTTYRIVGLLNKHTERVMGAYDSLYIQYWSDDLVSFASLVQARSTATDVTSTIFSRLVGEQKAVVVVQKEYTNVMKVEDSYILFLFKLYDNRVENNLLSNLRDFDNGYWGTTKREYSFNYPERKVEGLLVYELSEEDNAGKTSIEFFDTYLKISNIDVPESYIEIEFRSLLIDD